ncbi:MAG: MBL fold metallo-hydrolase [Planctomycetes bacterium]|nr:MBL fold metallo-hydrolase [Planctomycetota bacterium]
MPTNAYLLKDEREAAGVVVDPGGDADKIARRCAAEGIAPLYIVNTHGHIDHIGANATLSAHYPDALLCIGAADAPRLLDPLANLSAALGMSDGAPKPDLLLQEGDRLEFGASALEVLETPGHTPGGISLLARGGTPAQLFCGDALFRRGMGRTDLPGGDAQALLDSIEEKIFALPDETVVWPGHGEPTTVGEEKRENPFLTGCY